MNTVRVTPGSSPDSGPFRRLPIEDEQTGRRFPRSIYVGDPMVTGPEVQVQSYTPDNGLAAICHLVISVTAHENGVAGSADIMLSPDEAERVAHMLVIAAQEARDLPILPRLAGSAVTA